MVNPLKIHWIVVKRILRYLSGTAIDALMLSRANPVQKFSLQAYNNFDWTNDPDDRTSTSNSCGYFGPNLIS